jgi:hypothetical protein
MELPHSRKGYEELPIHGSSLSILKYLLLYSRMGLITSGF